MEVGLGEKLTDVGNKLRLAGTVVMNMFPGGKYQLGSIKREGPHGPYEARCFKNVPNSVGPQIRHYLRENGDKDWMVYGSDRVTFRQAEQLIDNVGAELAASFGVKKGTVVSIAMRNSPEYCLAFLAATAMGAVGVPLNSLWGTQELEYAVKDSDTELIIGDIERLRLCLPFVSGGKIKLILCRGTPEEAKEVGATLWEDVVAAGKGKPYPSIEHVQANDTVMIMYTSGSTGFPKGVVHSQHTMNNWFKLSELSKLMVPDPAPACLMAVPLFHITALAAIFLMSLPRAEKIAFMYKWDAGDALKIVEQEKISRFTGVPTMVADMMNHPEFSPEKVKTLKQMLAGGGPVPKGQVEKLRNKAKGIASGQGYALTETFAAGTTNSGTDYLKNPGSCGKPLPLLVDLVIKDPKGNKLGAGERGEICIKSCMVMKGYQNKPDATAEVIDKEGYFHTGDVGEIHGGFVYIKDRLKDIIIRAGENIDCSEVEHAFYTYPGEAVREVSVFGLPDERMGEVVGACVYLANTDVSAAELCKHASQHLAKFKVPEVNHVFLTSEALPKGATGKIDKKGMREFYKAQMVPASKL
jgi:acyl-CoA synthetase (AMP-forming)/AMP-acid ligase II